jgi:hypothetical protein
MSAWRGVTVRAEPRDVWPWVVQIRLAPYSYDWLDNLGHRSPREPRELPDPVPGDYFTAALGGRPAGRVLSVTPGEQLTARIMGAFLSYVLVPEGPVTRLLLKVVEPPGRRATLPLWTTLLSAGDLIMARRQLLNLARLAEQHRQPARP